jgi:uncharacterized protein YciI
MKTTLIVGAIAFCLFFVPGTFAQTNASSPCADSSDMRAWKVVVLSNYQSTNPDEKKKAVEAGKKYVEKSERCAYGNDEFVPWLKIHLAQWDGLVGTATTPGSAQTYDPELAKKLGADERGMKMYVLCILKTGPKDTEIKGKERDDIFAGHFANIGRLAEAGQLAVAGPFDKNDRNYRGLYIFNVPTIEEAEKLVVLDPAVKAGIFIPELTLWYASAGLMGVNDIHKRISKPPAKPN